MRRRVVLSVAASLSLVVALQGTPSSAHVAKGFAAHMYSGCFFVRSDPWLGKIWNCPVWINNKTARKHKVLISVSAVFIYQGTFETKSGTRRAWIRAGTHKVVPVYISFDDRYNVSNDLGPYLHHVHVLV